TEACFVGEPSGSPPTHFGDSKKIRLEASDLTLRVSTRYWPNGANDFRSATAAHVDVVPAAADYFAGRDPVLEAALTYEPPATTAAQVEDLLRRGKTQAAVFRFVRDLLDPRVEHRSVEQMVEAGNRLLDDEHLAEGRIVFLLTAEYYPESAAAELGWGRALELTGDIEGARRHYEKALAIDPQQRPARLALDRLDPSSRAEAPPSGTRRAALRRHPPSRPSRRGRCARRARGTRGSRRGRPPSRTRCRSAASGRGDRGDPRARR
ncbi:MAG: tetratricopeptide repeat protein, partial [Thermoanaerobaculia bacterium]|nr:tetratricopeptide repeat protein [Thermoanaerobaculia bacterium]